MFTVILTLKQSGNVQLMFDKHDNAKRAYAAIKGAMRAGQAAFDDTDKHDEWVSTLQVEVMDDYSTTLTIDGETVASVFLQDISRHLEGAAELQMLQQRANAALQKRVASDPQLRFLTNHQNIVPAQGMMRG